MSQVADAAPLSALPWSALWQGRRRFVVLHTGGGTGLADFLRLWQRWRSDPQRCQRLHMVLLCEHADEAAAALDAARRQAGTADAADAAGTDLLAELHAQWPPLTPDLHPLELDGGRVHLLLCLGPMAQVLPRLRLQADLLCLEAAAAQPAPQRLRVLKALARLAAPEALACGAGTGPAVLAELCTAGFQPDAQAPAGQAWTRHRPHPPRRGAVAPRHAWAGEADASGASSPRTALVIGAGVAGAAAARALAGQGLTVTVLDRQALPAAETSGNPAALFHGTVNPDDGPYARLFRAAALVAQRDYASACAPAAHRPGAAPPVPGAVHGLLRLHTLPPQAEAARQTEQMAQQLQRLNLPPGYVQALSAAQASALAGRALAAPAWFYPGGGWIDPAAWVAQALQTEGVHFRGGVSVHAVRPLGSAWQALDEQGRVLAQADVLVVACAVGSLHLLQPEALAWGWPLRQTRGQVTQVPVQANAGAPAGTDAGERELRIPVAGDGYALPLPTPAVVLCGATRHADVLRDRAGPGAGAGQIEPMTVDEALSLPSAPAQDHRHNLQRLLRLTGLRPQPGAELLGRVGWRLHSDDRLPIAGAVPERQGDPAAQPAADLQAPAQAGARHPGPVRVDQARHWPRTPGLFILTALGARGLTLAPLLGRLVAAQATGTPWPLEQSLADAVDPVRWALRAARSGQSAGGAGTATRARPGRPQDAG